jgi:hypothetical protein
MAHVQYGKGAGANNAYMQESAKFIAAAFKGTPMQPKTFTGTGRSRR